MVVGLRGWLLWYVWFEVLLTKIFISAFAISSIISIGLVNAFVMQRSKEDRIISVRLSVSLSVSKTGLCL